MGISLENENGSHQSYSISTWITILQAAQEHGWNPVGTEAPCDFEGEWNGSYTVNANQFVTREDAAALAHALDSMSATSTFETVADKLREFAGFCRQGQFWIH